jgi:hypothetical protein
MKHNWVFFTEFSFAKRNAATIPEHGFGNKRDFDLPPIPSTSIIS